MFYRTAFKWLTITVIVLGAFLMVLLFLGYLLKENEEITTKLKLELEQEASEQQAKNERKNNPFERLSVPLTPTEKSQQSVITGNQYCERDNQCFVVHTESKALGCVVAINTTGAAILLKISAQNNRNVISSNRCLDEYARHQEVAAQCRENRCSY